MDIHGDLHVGVAELPLDVASRETGRYHPSIG
jgi:hypothetical protein